MNKWKIGAISGLSADISARFTRLLEQVCLHNELIILIEL